MSIDFLLYVRVKPNMLWWHILFPCGSTPYALWQHTICLVTAHYALWQYTLCLVAAHPIPCRSTPHGLWHHTLCLVAAHPMLCGSTPHALWQHTYALWQHNPCLMAAHPMPCGSTPHALWQDTGNFVATRRERNIARGSDSTAYPRVPNVTSFHDHVLSLPFNATKPEL
jgi:hypothetical protein